MNSIKPIDILKKHYGYDSFRGGQEELVNAILSKQDVLGIMPTGAGKSICFQVPALMFNNVTLVISPLISLMQDQVNALRQSGIPAAYINSALSTQEYWNVLDETRMGHYKLIYVSPERLETEGFINFIQSIRVDMVTVDEAHCISQWGQDFRPSYVAIPDFISKLPYRPIVSAFTATATDNVKNDIIAMLRLNNPFSITTGFDRRNLYFAVDRFQKEKEKMTTLENFLSSRPDESGIIYCSSRKSVEQLCYSLNQVGFKATRYHAGLSDSERQQNQEDFLFDRFTTMVATNAFGMGIDKSNVSYVVHYNMPKDIESYYQEAGRAGRDGRESFCLMLYSKSDTQMNKWFIDKKEKDLLADNKVDPKSIKKLMAIDYNRLDKMVIYSTTNLCLRNFILRYFGENPKENCGKCSNCQNSKNLALVDITEDVKKILSCIYRLNQNYGTKMVIDVLRGSKSSKITELKFNELSTYKITETSAKTLEEIIVFLIENEYINRDAGKFQILKLGKRYKEALKSDAQIKAHIQVKTIKVKEEVTTSYAHRNDLSPEKLDLYNKIKSLCKEIASKEKVPAFYIFVDKTLIDMAQKSPKNEKEFLQVSGVGEAKLAKYGKLFIDLINQES